MMETTDIQNYIVPIVASSKATEEQGVAVLVDNLLVTAGHVLNGQDSLLVTIKGKHFRLNTKDALLPPNVSCEEKGTKGFDICVFKIRGIKSTLQFAEENPNVGDDLVSISHKHIVTANPSKVDSTNIFDNNIQEGYEIKLSYGVVKEVENNFFSCEMSEPLEQGRSGSPILCGNKVVGILRGGVGDVGYTCVYQTSKSIINLLKGECNRQVENV